MTSTQLEVTPELIRTTLKKMYPPKNKVHSRRTFKFKRNNYPLTPVDIIICNGGGSGAAFHAFKWKEDNVWWLTKHTTLGSETKVVEPGKFPIDLEVSSLPHPEVLKLMVKLYNSLPTQSE